MPSPCSIGGPRHERREHPRTPLCICIVSFPLDVQAAVALFDWGRRRLICSDDYGRGLKAPERHAKFSAKLEL